MVDRAALPPAGHTDFGQSRWLWLWLIGFCFAGWALRLAVAVAFTSIERPDEIFQNLEPAYRLWTGDGIITWEWRAGIRSWLFPGALSSLLFLSSLLHLPDRAAIPLIWAALSLVSCGVIVVGVLIGWRRFGATGAILCGILTAFWPDLVYFGPKTLVEVQAGNLLVVAVALASRGPTRRTPWRLAGIGVLLGIGFALRFQLSLSLLLVACWAARLDIRRSWVPLILGAAIPLAMLAAVDWWTLGTAFQSIWKNIYVNLIENKAAEYGVAPLYRYLQWIVSRNSAASVLMAVLFLYGFSRAWLFSLTALSVVIFHSFIAHKEISFIYAGLPCAIVTIGLGAARVVNTMQHALIRPPSPRRALIVASAVALATVATVALGARSYTVTLKQTAMTTLLPSARAQPDLCGLGFYADGEFPWYDTGGYAFLRRHVPIYLATSPESFADSRISFNYAVAQRSLRQSMPGFSIVQCSRDYCLFHQPVQCQPTSAHEISTELARTNQ